MKSLLQSPATEQVRLVASGSISALELITAHLERIQALEPKLNAFVDVRREEALAEARARTRSPRVARRAAHSAGCR